MGSLIVDNSLSILSATFGRPANTTQYAAGDIVSDSAAQLVFAGAALAAGESGTILTAQLHQNANQSTLGSFELNLFSSKVAVQTDNAAAAFTNAEMLTWVGGFAFTSSYILNAGSGAAGNVVWQARNLNLDYRCGSGETALYGLLVVRNAYTPVSQEVFKVMLKVRRY